MVSTLADIGTACAFEDFLVCSHNTVEKRSRQTRESLTEEPSQEQEELKDILHELREDLDPEILNKNFFVSVRC